MTRNSAGNQPRTSHDGTPGDSRQPAGEQRTTSLTTIPNLLCLIRLFGSPGLIVLAWLDQPTAFALAFLFLVMTDWVDGKLAIWLNQRSVWGARLDSWADAALYCALLIGGLWLRWRELVSESGWIVPAVGSYAVSTAAGYWKFGRWPSYHTRAAKTSWLLITIGAVAALADWSPWPLRIALAAVTLTNLEAIWITSVLPRWHADVSSIFRARELARLTKASNHEGHEERTR